MSVPLSPRPPLQPALDCALDSGNESQIHPQELRAAPLADLLQIFTRVRRPNDESALTAVRVERRLTALASAGEKAPQSRARNRHGVRRETEGE
jgi:hypothetical protein